MYGIRDGDIISLDNEKAGALTYSVDLHAYRAGGDPADLWEKQPAIRTVTGEIAREVGSVPLHHYRRTSDTDRTRLSDSPVASLLRSPAPGIGAARYYEQLMLDLAVHDRWGCLIDYDGQQLRLRRLPPNRIALGISGGVRVGLWYFPTQGEPVLIPLNRVVFDIAPSALPDSEVTNKMTPSSRLLTLTDLASELQAIGEWRGQVARNGARVPAVIERPADAGDWSDTAFARFKAGMDDFKKGGGTEGGIPILEDGMTMRKVDVFNPRDFDTAAIRQLTLVEACLLYHYPPELLGAREGTYSNVAAFREMKWVDVLGSWIVNLEQALTVGLVAGGWVQPDEYIEANVDAKLRGAFEVEATAYASATGRPWMTTNEVRARKNLPAIDGGDDIVTPLNVLVGGLANPRDTAPPPEAAPKARRATATKADRPADFGTVDAERDAAAARLGVFWELQAARIRAALDQKAVADTVSAFDRDSETAALTATLRAVMQRLAEVGAWDVLATWNPESDGWSPSLIEAYIAKAAETNAGRWSQAVEQGLADAASDPATAGPRVDTFLSSTTLSTGLAAAFITQSLSFGRQDAATKSGLSSKTWRVRSTNPRVSHAAQNGQTVPIGDVFANGLRWPGDHFGSADENAGCTCELEYSRD